MPTQTPADGPQTGHMDTLEARRQTVDRWIAAMAEKQQGLVTLGQLGSVGLTGDAVRKRVERGRLHPQFEGVYAVGYPALTRESRYMAAVLACGASALLSHESAGELWGIRESPGRLIHVTAPNRRGRSPAGILAHRDSSIVTADRTAIRRIPCTTVSRTLLDLAAGVSTWELRKAVAEAEVQGLLDIGDVRVLIRRSRGRRGVARLRLCIDALDPTTKRTRSELERRFLRLCKMAGLPRPEVNVPLDVGGLQLRPDFLWRDSRLILEADGRRYHSTGSAFELDREREQRFYAAGWQVIRCTWRQVEAAPHLLIRSLRTGLERASPPFTADGPQT